MSATRNPSPRWPHRVRRCARRPVRKPEVRATAQTAVPYRYDIMPHVLAVLADRNVRDLETLRDQFGDRMRLIREQRLALRPGIDVSHSRVHETSMRGLSSI